VREQTTTGCHVDRGEHSDTSAGAIARLRDQSHHPLSAHCEAPFGSTEREAMQRTTGRDRCENDSSAGADPAKLRLWHAAPVAHPLMSSSGASDRAAQSIRCVAVLLASSATHPRSSTRSGSPFRKSSRSPSRLISPAVVSPPSPAPLPSLRSSVPSESISCRIHQRSACRPLIQLLHPPVPPLLLRLFLAALSTSNFSAMPPIS
jgi:hypothetical protein